ncbi:Lacal_2735 family protein [Cyclobacterium sp.]|uniref:Lacal_2735 family protein n=1 Tax=Cyclobacterium sp. TaxID=1966343 RepID=UPI00198B6D39|nr:Lacal_2735 family protein [Cyclobacterium sp.]MBD3627008.1 Lacal_2735 family protein [Cyclobacterium sp.]
MFGLFKKKTEIEKLQEQYEKLLQRAHKASHQDRTLSDQLMTQAEEIAKKIDTLKN